LHNKFDITRQGALRSGEPAAEPVLNEYEFRLLRDYIHNYCGIYFGDGKKSTLASRIRFRLKLLDIPSYAEYYNYLKYNPHSREEMDDLIPHLTNNETYFFREMVQLELFAGDLIERIREGRRKSGQKAIKILSCGCSSGEEVFTLAMLLEERGFFLDDWRIELTGIDIDRKVLEKASKAVYSSYSMRATDKGRIFRFFDVDGDKYRVKDRVRSRVSFVRGNIMETETFRAFSEVDAILCRNVLIYFSDEAIARIAETFHRQLHMDGFLLLGHSESLTRVTDIFYPKRFPNTIVYSKRG